MNDDLGSIDKSKLAYNLYEAAEATGYSTSTLRIAIRRNDLIAGTPTPSWSFWQKNSWTGSRLSRLSRRGTPAV
ncbi:hypothetical protein FBY33_2664 [Arthrobacter sp. SLBN-112]|jgi:hypothetical protein|uniref:hypothetical protein n=1 Tax=Arthrobacter sp. SLBN-112 TaxID=2768452 RepID=UPI001151D037|nr:hypothetical protein [Arthrobacter sp. SLBN-112]TQJ40597.1 hypothetical protein FBY33_2664 [Arthrobacter sp. SLBN-112]